jgi:hypothetical protein
MAEYGLRVRLEREAHFHSLSNKWKIITPDNYGFPVLLKLIKAFDIITKKV